MDADRVQRSKLLLTPPSYS